MSKKFLSIVGITFLLIGVSIQPAIADSIVVNRESTQWNNDSGDWDLGFILCQVIFINPNSRQIIYGRGEIVECLDLDTGEEIQGKTRLLGFHLFKFLTIGHDYEISVDTEYGYSEFTIEYLGFFSRVEIVIEFWS